MKKILTMLLLTGFTGGAYVGTALDALRGELETARRILKEEKEVL